MRVPTEQHRADIGFNMTPMIDVVFLLIIFFLVSSHLAKQESQMELPLPVAVSGDLPTPTQVRRLTLNVLGTGEMRLSGRRIVSTELQSRLAEARERSGEIEVRIRGDRGVAYRHIEPLMLACARAGIWNVTFGVHGPEDAQ
jgi:biopolymer transport protein ExbD